MFNRISFMVAFCAMLTAAVYVGQNSYSASERLSKSPVLSEKLPGLDAATVEIRSLVSEPSVVLSWLQTP